MATTPSGYKDLSTLLLFLWESRPSSPRIYSPLVDKLSPLLDRQVTRFGVTRSSPTSFNNHCISLAKLLRQNTQTSCLLKSHSCTYSSAYPTYLLFTFPSQLAQISQCHPSLTLRTLSAREIRPSRPWLVKHTSVESQIRYTN